MTREPGGRCRKHRQASSVAATADQRFGQQGRMHGEAAAEVQAVSGP